MPVTGSFPLLSWSRIGRKSYLGLSLVMKWKISSTAMKQLYSANTPPSNHFSFTATMVMVISGTNAGFRCFCACPGLEKKIIYSKRNGQVQITSYLQSSEKISDVWDYFRLFGSMILILAWQIRKGVCCYLWITRECTTMYAWTAQKLCSYLRIPRVAYSS